MKLRDIIPGAEDQSVVIRIKDSTSFLPEETVEYDTAGISLWYRREESLKVTITPAALAGLDSAHADGGIEHIDDGYYRLDVPNAAVAIGKEGVMIGGSLDGMIVEGVYVALNLGIIWDEILTGATHNVPGSAGKRLREQAGMVIRSELARGPGTNDNQIQLDVDASDVDGAYDPAMIAIVAGTGAGQSRLILQYEGSSRIATVGRNWKVLPADDSEYVIYAHPGREHVNEGLARGGDTDEIILNELASPKDDAYKGQVIFIRSGTGEDQARMVKSYAGSSKVAVVNRDWDITPDTTSGYVMLPASILAFSDIVDLIQEAMTTTMYAESTGGSPPAEACLADKIGYPYKGWRNKWTQNKETGEQILYADDGETPDQKAVNEDTGSLFTRGPLEGA